MGPSMSTEPAAIRAQSISSGLQCGTVQAISATRFSAVCSSGNTVQINCSGFPLHLHVSVRFAGCTAHRQLSPARVREGCREHPDGLSARPVIYVTNISFKLQLPDARPVGRSTRGALSTPLPEHR